MSRGKKRAREEAEANIIVGSEESDSSSSSSSDSSDSEDEGAAGGGGRDSCVLLAGAPSETSRTVFVEGIPFSATDAEVEAFFADVGEIESLRMPKFQDSGRAMGYAHVTFSTKDQMERALRKDGEYLGSRFLSIDRARPPKAPPVPVRHRPAGCTTLFVKNLPYDTDEETVALAFQCVNVKRTGAPDRRLARVDWTRDMHTQRLKGFGYVQFAKGPSATEAVTAGDVEVGGRTLLLDYETGAPKQSFKNAEGRNWAKVNKKLAASLPGKPKAKRQRRG